MTTYERYVPPVKPKTNYRKWLIGLAIGIVVVAGLIGYHQTNAYRCTGPRAASVILTHRLNTDAAAIESGSSPSAALDGMEALDESETLINAHPACFSDADKAAIEYWTNYKNAS